MSEGELRAMVREVLREALAARSGGAKSAARPPASAPTARPPAPSRAIPPAAESVRIQTDADLAAFVRKIATLCTDPAAAAAIREGRRCFTLAKAGGHATDARPPAAANSTAVTLSGTITEAKVAALPNGSVAVLGPGAVMTPLARDRARAMGIRIERRR